MKDHHVTGHKGYFGKSDCSAEAFLDLLEDRLSVSELNFAGSVEKNIPIYSASEIEPTFRQIRDRRLWQSGHMCFHSALASW